MFYFEFEERGLQGSSPDKLFAFVYTNLLTKINRN